MPIYEYRCDSCNRTVEQLGRMSDPEILQLDGCKPGEFCALKRIFSLCAFRVGKDPDYAPPGTHTPITRSITRDFMAPDGTITPMTQAQIAASPFVGENA